MSQLTYLFHLYMILHNLIHLKKAYWLWYSHPRTWWGLYSSSWICSKVNLILILCLLGFRELEYSDTEWWDWQLLFTYDNEKEHTSNTHFVQRYHGDESDSSWDFMNIMVRHCLECCFAQTPYSSVIFYGCWE
jgi:hypothetical protein